MEAKAFLGNEWVKNEIKEAVKNYLKAKESEHRTAPNLWDTVKAVLRGKFRALQAYLKKQENLKETI